MKKDYIRVDVADKKTGRIRITLPDGTYHNYKVKHIEPETLCDNMEWVVLEDRQILDYEKTEEAALLARRKRINDKLTRLVLKYGLPVFDSSLTSERFPHSDIGLTIEGRPAITTEKPQLVDALTRGNFTLDTKVYPTVLNVYGCGMNYVFEFKGKTQGDKNDR